jgi:peptidylprolyl isomerase
VPTGFKATPTTPKTLTDLGVYPVIKGKGPVVKKGQTIVVNYLGQLYPDGKVFDESYSTDEPATFQIGAGQVIPGWDDGLVGQTVGSRVILAIPSAQGYGKTGKSPAIPPDSDLIFSVDILQAY